VEKGNDTTLATLLPQDETLLNNQFIRTARCDVNSHYEVANLRPGSYYIFAFDRVEYDALSDVNFVRGLHSRAVSIDVEAGHVSTAALRLIPWPE
jgi:hypothetical protein